MPGALNHLDDCTLFRHVCRDLSEFEEKAARRHLRSCGACRRNLEKIEELDHLLREAGPELFAETDSEDLPSGDPFRLRPASRPLTGRAAGTGGRARATQCLAAAKEAARRKDRLLSFRDAGEKVLRGGFDELRLSEPTDRYTIGYALEEAVSRMVEGPARWLRFAEASRTRLAAEPKSRRSTSVADSAYPLADLVGRAHLLSGIARNWTGEFERGGRDLLLAYRAFSRGTASEVDLARVELAEATRRSFVERAPEGLVLASRAARTFAEFGIADEEARALAVKGLALSRHGRGEEALLAYREALPALERLGLWNAYASTLQNVGATLMHLGRLGEARREYARALRKVSRTERPAVHAFIRQNLARTQFEAGEFAQAASGFGSATSLFEQQGAMADALLALLFQIESFARAGAGVKARFFMAGFKRRVQELDALDASTLKELDAALSGRNPDLASLVRLRDEVEETLRERLEGSAG